MFHVNKFLARDRFLKMRCANKWRYHLLLAHSILALSNFSFRRQDELAGGQTPAVVLVSSDKEKSYF